ncbi:hypothetical protein GBAR_LOCUS29257, partial [Geodia barretti]
MLPVTCSILPSSADVFSLTIRRLSPLHFRRALRLSLQLSAECREAVIQVDDIRVVPGVLESYVSTEVEGHNVSVSVGSIPSDVSVQTGLLQVSTSTRDWNCALSSYTY